MKRTRSNKVKHTLKDGTVKVYSYPRSKKRVAPAQGTIGWALRQYLVSQEFTSLAPGSQVVYRRALKLFDPIRQHDLNSISRQHIYRIRDALSTKPGAANSFIAAAGAFFVWSLERGYRTDYSPVAKIKRLPIKTRGPWPDEVVAKAKAEMQGIVRLAFLLGLHTGQRIGDILSMRWSDFDGEGIAVKQQKTGIELWVPCSVELLEALRLARAEATGLTIVSRPDGRPISTDSFEWLWKREVRRLGLTGHVFHELRHTAAVRLAETGATAHEIGSITGHQTLATLQRYTKAAEQKKLARAAIAKVENFSPRQNGKKLATNS
ncbi:MAG: tyrosine-type recombinase/integrase [Ferrovibrio sp.]|nr:tyrosine-type recombinase/integrase [Ferrovibrio sp.]